MSKGKESFSQSSARVLPAFSFHAFFGFSYSKGKPDKPIEFVTVSIVGGSAYHFSMNAICKKVVCLFSGGMDSTVLLHRLLADRFEVSAISINYGQRHEKELLCAADISKSLAIQHRTVDLRSLQPLFLGSSLTDSNVEVPHGHYTAESMKSTVVPNRNMIMLSVAAAWAINLRADCVAFAAHSGDHTVYPDCRPEFAESLGKAIRLADWHEVALLAPFIRLSKAEICREGDSLGVDFARTWSCYQGGALHCARCGTCVERKEAFELAGVRDPTKYELIV